MALPLKDLGSVKISEAAHSYLRARATLKRVELVALVRDLVEAYVKEEIHISSMAAEIHQAKGLGEIQGDMQ